MNGFGGTTPRACKRAAKAGSRASVSMNSA
jgi:hypothetical protein